MKNGELGIHKRYHANLPKPGNWQAEPRSMAATPNFTCRVLICGAHICDSNDKVCKEWDAGSYGYLVDNTTSLGVTRVLSPAGQSDWFLLGRPCQESC